MKTRTVEYRLGRGGTGAYNFNYDSPGILVLPRGRVFLLDDYWCDDSGECYRRFFCEISRHDAAEFLREFRSSTKASLKLGEEWEMERLKRSAIWLRKAYARSETCTPRQVG